MRSISMRLIIAFVTFVVGIAAVSFWVFHRFQAVRVSPAEETRTASVPYNPCSFSRTENKKVTASEAVHLAECFVIQNEYTDLPPMEDTSKLVYETFDDAPPAGHALELRRNTLERRAYGVRDGGKGKERVDTTDGWTVIFRYNPKPDTVRFYGDRLSKVGRIVTMDAYGNYMRMQHQDYTLSMFRKLEEYTRE